MFTFNCKGKLVLFNEPIVMGIINITPDSFYAGSRVNTMQGVIQRAGRMLDDGAGIIDVGGQSTRPGSSPILEEDELQRVIPVIASLHQHYPDAILSIDTFYSRVAKEAIDAGASIVNDVSAGTIDPLMITTVATLQVPYVLMHMPGNPENMQQHAKYKNVVLEVFDFLNFKMATLVNEGIRDIIIDVGFGFGKTLEHNFQLLHHLSFFQQLSRPVMVGLSRKATIYKTLNTTPEQALNGSTVLHTVALMEGASLLRVHDVLEAVEAVRLFSALQKEKSSF